MDRWTQDANCDRFVKEAFLNFFLIGRNKVAEYFFLRRRRVHRLEDGDISYQAHKVALIADMIGG